jgi:hypothetical protein
MSNFLNQWLVESHPDAAAPALVLLQEMPGSRVRVRTAIEENVKDHLAGLDIIERIGSYPKALAYVRNKLPTSKRVRSGDFGEILASEYIDQCTDYTVPIKKLRWKDDRSVAMRGNDVIAIRCEKNRWYLLKVESKSRASLSAAAVTEAAEGLAKNSGRPNPSSLAFISARLREQGKDAEAAVFEELQTRTLSAKDVSHMVFTLSGNDPMRYLKKLAVEPPSKFTCHLVGCVIADHADFIERLFQSLHAGKRR